MTKFKRGDIVRIKKEAYVSGSVCKTLSPKHRVGVVVDVIGDGRAYVVFSNEDFKDNLSKGFDVPKAATWLCHYSEDELKLLKRFNE